MALKQRTKAFADKLVEDESLSQTDAYLMTHKTNDRATARVNASQLLTKPEVQIYMETHVNAARSKIVQLAKSDNEKIALSASQDILDRSFGKALTKTNNLNFNVNVEQALDNLI